MTDQRITYANNREQWPEGRWDSLRGDADAPHPNLRCRRIFTTDDGHVMLCGLPVHNGASDNACIFHTSANRDRAEVVAALEAANQRGVRLNDINFPSTPEPTDALMPDTTPPAEAVSPAEPDAAAFSTEAVSPEELTTQTDTESTEVSAALVESPHDIVPASDDTATISADESSAAPVGIDALSDALVESLADSLVEAVDDTAAPAEPDSETTPSVSWESVELAENADVVNVTRVRVVRPRKYLNNKEEWPKGLWDELRGEADAPPDHLRCQHRSRRGEWCGLPIYNGMTDKRCIFHTAAKCGRYELHQELEAAVERNARLDEAKLANAQIVGTRPNETSPWSTHLCNAKLPRADLSGAHLWNVNLYGADLSEAVFVGAELPEINLCRTQMWHARLNNTDLSEALFIGAHLRQAIFADAQLSETDFTSANLCRADLARVDLREANFSNASLYGAKLLGTVDLTDADLRGARLSGFTLSPDARINGTRWGHQGVIFDERRAHRRLLLLTRRGENLRKWWRRESLCANFRACADVYRQIKRCYQTSGEYATAGRFFIREMECERMARALTPPHTVPPSEQLRDGWTRVRSKTRAIIRGLSVATQPARRRIANRIRNYRASVAEAAPDFWAKVEQHARPIRNIATNAAKDIRADFQPHIDRAGAWFAKTAVGAEVLRLWKAACPHIHSAATIIATVISIVWRHAAPLCMAAGWLLWPAGLWLWRWAATGLGHLLDSEFVSTPDFMRRIRRGLGPFNGWARKIWKWFSHNATRALWFLSYHTSKHGEAPAHVVWTMIGTIVTFALSYLACSPEYTNGESLIDADDPFLKNFGRAFYFSVITFTSLGYGDEKPAAGACQNLVMLEVFLGVILIALFAGCMIRKISR